MAHVTYRPAVLGPVHCSQCGTRNPGTDQGYTGCCNEPTCSGAYAGGLSTWAVGTMAHGETRQTGTVRACCAAAAEASLPDGLLALWLER